ncbi:MAG: flippase [Clostridia bacterium]|nr:flippase [Clostridia bacterium]
MIKNRMLKNAYWIIACKILQSILNLFVGVISARYLGPANYGIIAYASSIIAFALPLMQLGLQSILVQEITHDNENEGKIMGSALTLSIFSSLLCMIGVIGFTFFANREDSTTVIVCAIYSISIFFQAAEMIIYWFQAKLLSKYSSIIILLAYVAVMSYKIYLLATGKNLYWFAFTPVINGFLVALGLVVVYLKKGAQKLSFSLSYAKKLFSKSKFFIISSMMITIFQNTDKLMIQSMLGEAYVGYYTAALTVAGVVGFVYSAIIDSANPVIIEAKKIEQAKFEKNISSLYSVIFYLAIIQGLVITLLAEPIIQILYGAAYAPAISALRVGVWQISFSCFGTVRNIWMWAEKKYKYIWIIDVSGAILNVILNYFLIPIWGISGAAFASFATQFFANFLLGFIIKPIQKNNFLLMKGCNPIYLISFVKTYLKKKEKLKEE